MQSKIKRFSLMKVPQLNIIHVTAVYANSTLGRDLLRKIVLQTWRIMVLDWIFPPLKMLSESAISKDYNLAVKTQVVHTIFRKPQRSLSQKVGYFYNTVFVPAD